MNSRLSALLVAVLAIAIACSGERDRELLLATTTSVQDSGLLDALLPAFSEETGIRVRVIAVGTGAALRMGEEGNVDALITHAPGPEQKLLDSGVALSRRAFMQNHFVLAGPAGDPAGVRSAGSAAQALRRLSDAGAPFVSRGDDSGTHKRERELLEAAGLDPGETWEGFVTTGTGMGLTLQVAGERRAYVLSDIGTFLAFQERTQLEVLSQREPALRNEYAFLLLDPERFGGKIRLEAARALEHFLTRDDVRRRIASFGEERFGTPLFVPLDAM